MKTKSVVPRELARQDVSEAIDYYLQEGGAQVALGFVDALEVSYAQIGRQPAVGSPRYAHELNLPGLRFAPLRRYPFLVFHFERDDHIDLWRVLHAERDIPAWMRVD